MNEKHKLQNFKNYTYASFFIFTILFIIIISYTKIMFGLNNELTNKIITFYICDFVLFSSLMFYCIKKYEKIDWFFYWKHINKIFVWFILLSIILLSWKYIFTIQGLLALLVIALLFYISFD